MIDTAAGYPQYSGGVIPSIVRAGKILENFYAATVFGDICNTDYEGEIKEQGDKVEIVGEPLFTTHAHKKGERFGYDVPEVPVKYLYIDKARRWNHQIDRIDKFQSDHDYLAKWAVGAAKQMKIDVDADVLATVYASAAAFNSGATAGKDSQNINLGATGAPLQVTNDNILKLIAQMGQVLDEQNIPDNVGERCLVIPPWVATKIKLSAFQDATVAGDGTSMMRNGRLGIIDRFTLYLSNNIKKTTDGNKRAFELFGCHKSAISFAAQITEMDEPFKAQDAFAWLQRGLMVYGYEVLQPTALVHAHIYE